MWGTQRSAPFNNPLTLIKLIFKVNFVVTSRSYTTNNNTTSWSQHMRRRPRYAIIDTDAVRDFDVSCCLGKQIGWPLAPVYDPALGAPNVLRVFPTVWDIHEYLTKYAQPQVNITLTELRFKFRTMRPMMFGSLIVQKVY